MLITYAIVKMIMEFNKMHWILENYKWDDRFEFFYIKEEGDI